MAVPHDQEEGPTALGRYELLEELGRGGMGSVWRARDPKLDRDVAIKRLFPDALSSSTRRLVREAQALARVEHPNVVRVFDVGIDDDGPTPIAYVAMELVDGIDLARWMVEHPDAGWRSQLPLVIAAGRGLQAIHDAGLVHRDLKPGNILVSRTAPTRVWVTDFGLAKLDGQPSDSQGSDEDRDLGALPDPGITAPGVALGTPSYMAPEQHTDEPCTAAADQFGLAAVAFRLLYRAVPYQADGWEALYEAKLKGPVFPGGADVPAAVVTVLRRALDPTPSRRWSSITELVAELQRASRPRRVWPAVAVCVGALGLIGLSLPAAEAPAAAEVVEEPAPVAVSKIALDDPLVKPVVDALDRRDFETARTRIDELRTRADGEPRAAGLRIAADILETPLLTQDGETERAHTQLSRGLQSSTAAEEIELALLAARLLESRAAKAGATEEVEALARLADSLVTRSGREDLRWWAMEMQAPDGPVVADRDGELRILVATLAAVRERDDVPPREECRLLVRIAQNRLAAQETVVAKRWAEEGVACAREHVPEQDYVRPLSETILQSTRALSGDDAFFEYHDEVMALLRRTVGPEHEWVALELSRASVAHRKAGRSEAALPLARESLRVFRLGFGEETAQILTGIELLASILEDLGRYDEASEQYQRLWVGAAELGWDDAVVAALGSLAEIDARRGHPERARDRLERAIEASPDGLWVAQAHAFLAQLARDRGDEEVASRECAQAHATLRPASPGRANVERVCETAEPAHAD